MEDGKREEEKPVTVMIDPLTAIIFFGIGFVSGAVVALWNVVTKLSTHTKIKK